MKIAIVENESVHVEHIQNILQQYQTERQVKLDITYFTSGETLLEAQFKDFNVICLDIHLDGLNGMSTAHQLRKNNYSGEIVFLTSFAEYALDGYSVKALDFLVKPVVYEQVKKSIDFVFQKFNSGFYKFYNQSMISQIPYSQILYFSSDNHYINVVTTTKIHKHLESLKGISQALPKEFIYCHRTTIVNLNHVLMLKGKSLVLSNQETIPVSNTYLQDVKNALIAQIT